MKLSLYLYGELEFAEEEQLEEHVAECAVCERALAREKAWHSTVNAERADVPIEFLEQSRQELKRAVAAGRTTNQPRGLRSWVGALDFFAPPWSMRLALASFLLFTGFSAARWIDRYGLPGGPQITAGSMGVFDPSSTRIREIEPGENNRVRIVFDREQSISGPVDSAEMRSWLLAAIRDGDDPGVRVDSVEMLNGQAGREVQQALLYSARNDPNAAVRLKAVEGLGRFRDDPTTRDGLVFVLQHDENAGVRLKAIDALAPSSGAIKISPDVVGALQDVIRSGPQDDYVRMRCSQLLRQTVGPDVY